MLLSIKGRLYQKEVSQGATTELSIYRAIKLSNPYGFETNLYVPFLTPHEQPGAAESCELARPVS